MEQLHAHEVLHMMEGNSYTELSLREAIIQKFGEQQRFFTCSANNMDVLPAKIWISPASTYLCTVFFIVLDLRLIKKIGCLG